MTDGGGKKEMMSRPNANRNDCPLVQGLDRDAQIKLRQALKRLKIVQYQGRL